MDTTSSEQKGHPSPASTHSGRKLNSNPQVESGTGALNSMSREKNEKVGEIRRACADRDLNVLRKLATSEGGLLEDEFRRTAWPLLLGCEGQTADAASDSQDLPRHRDEDQVELDVHRSFVYYPAGESEKSKDARKRELSEVIVTVLRRHNMLHYFQGYHDIVQVLLLVLGANAACPAVARLSLLRIRDFMLPTMSGTEPHLRLLPAILYAADPSLSVHLSKTEPFFALPATLTLYAHQIEEYGEISRLFDFLLASEAAISVYLFAVVVISRKAELLEIEAEEPEMLHSILSKLPKPLNLDDLIRQTVELFDKYPPERLPGWIWTRISSNSVLKTTRNFSGLRNQTLEDGERFFMKEAAEIRRRDAFKRKQRQLEALTRRHKRPLAWSSAAMFVAIVAISLRRFDLPPSIIGLTSSWVGLQQKFIELWQRFSI